MKSTLAIMLIATLLFTTLFCITSLSMASVVIVYDPDTGTAKPIIIIGDE